MDVIIVGAGACGLMAGSVLAKNGFKVIILEARERAGGRIHTIQKGAARIELGAEFVHGNLPLTLSLLKEAGIEVRAFEGAFLQFENGEFKSSEEMISGEEDLLKALSTLQKDLPLDEALNKFNLSTRTVKEAKDYVEGYYAADTSRASAQALVHDLQNGFETQYTIPSGYASLIHFLENEFIQNGGRIHYETEVINMEWNENEVLLKTSKETFTASKVIVTLPPSLIINNKNLFNPKLDDQVTAFSQLGFGHVIKVLVVARKPFWKNALPNESAFIFSEERIPTWWKSEGMVLSGWVGGPSSLSLTPEKVKEAAIESLQKIFQNLDSQNDLEEIVCWDWSSDPFTRGAYSYDVPGGDLIKDSLLKPVNGRIYFSGEALYKGPMIGTVEAALQTGLDSAQMIIDGVV